MQATIATVNMVDNYALSRGEAEPLRLEAQHEVWTRNLGYHIHPSIAQHLNAASQIAEIGTGTGIFLIELSRQLPTTCQFDGFDISDAMYPSRAMIPANISFTLHDAKLAFPTALKQRYDFVHIRLMVSGLEKDDWDVVAANAIQLLKPGGAIQWAEAGFLQAAYLRGKASTTPRALEHVGHRFHEGMGHRLRHGYSALPTIFEHKGLRNVFQDIVASDRVSETRQALTQASYDGIFGWALKMQANSAPGAWTMEEVEELTGKCEEEIRGGCYCRFEMYVTIGFA